MAFSVETYRLVVKHVGSRADLCVLCRVSKGFQQVAEQALYNTIFAPSAWDTFRMCSLLWKTPRLAAMVEAMSLFVSEETDEDDSSPREVCLPNDFWSTVSNALHQTTRLRFLNLHLDHTGDTAQAWILGGTAFRLRSFHCDLQWDPHLVSFLNTQPDIEDLYIADYSFPDDTVGGSTSELSPLDPGSLPSLQTLECTFVEAAFALVPSRPVSRLKTCFSKTRMPEKKEELSLLFSRMTGTTHSLHSLDIADSSYSDLFSLELLASVVKLRHQIHNLRYLGTLVLPVDGNMRLKFYGLLRMLRSLGCVEVDVSEWDPPPPIPVGLRALASELRLYRPSLERVIFVSDFERTVIAVDQGTYALDYDSNVENIWREI
ncbi:hypothetical protein JVU11DRAFT_11872 [Chiua virens]|nr:hypothetical protein JVU11DRAFT_11872 [Chiua virens]